MTGPRISVALLSALALAAACGSESPPAAARASPALNTAELTPAAPGALVRMQLDSRVAVLLDELPAARRDAAAADALAKGNDFWVARAGEQLKLTIYRLVFRSGYYTDPRGPMPLPPKSIRDISITGRARRARVGGHDVVVVPYRFTSALLTDAASPAIVEPALTNVGGVWNEPFELPLDPTLLLERTGFACMNEFEFPPHSVFEEAVHYYYDQTCGVETAATASCHLTQLPTESCVTALDNHSGRVSTNMKFTRLPYDAATAARFRVGTIVNPHGADLAVVADDIANEHAVIYRFFEPASCEIDEGVIAQPGWRQLLTFSATVRNDGTLPLHIGNPNDPTNPWVKSNVFEFSACHHHFHFSHYGNFNYNGAPGSKRAFCLEDTNRYHNDEQTPLTAIHQTCEFQGIAAGWGDEYNFGLPGQWVDITDVNASQPHDLSFDANPDRFLCEGQPLGAAGQPVDPLDLANLVFDPTSFTDPNGNIVSRMRCQLPPAWEANNHGSISFSTDHGSFVTQPCARGQIGPLRSCGFGVNAQLHACQPGATVKLACDIQGDGTDPAQVVRICEKSAKLGRGTACTVGESVANAIIGAGSSLSFVCPAVRDDAGKGGYAVYTAPVLPGDLRATVSCHVQ